MHMTLYIFQLFFRQFWVNSGAIPPLVKTRGLNEDFSMSITIWLYLSSFLFHVVIRFSQLFKPKFGYHWNLLSRMK